MNSFKTGSHIVLAGGGHTHALFLRAWAMQPLAHVQLTVVSEQWYSPYSGMLPGLLAGDYVVDDTHVDLARLCQATGAVFIPARITGLDPDRQQLLLAERPPLQYDYLSINTGITPTALPGSDQHALALKPVSTLLQRWSSLRLALQPAHIAMIGGGAAGVEMIIAIRDALIDQSPDTRYSLLSAGPVLQGHSLAVQQRARRVLQQANIHLDEQCRVQRIEANAIIDEQGRRIEADGIFLATPGMAPAWIKSTGLATTVDGFIAVNDYLQSTSHPNVFAVGDIAVQLKHPRPRAGVFAVRQAKPLFHNLRAVLQQRSLIAYAPQKQFLSLLRCGQHDAIASRGAFHAQGHWVWRWKDRIDRRFMAMFNNLPAMKPGMRHEVTGAAMRCGGCGAKVGKTMLDDVLHELKLVCDTSTPIGLQHPDDAAVITPPANMQLVQSVDGFRAFIDDPYTFAVITAQHAISDLHAMGATPHSALAFVTLPHSHPVTMENTLRQIMAGASRTLQQEGMQLIGGHTAEGAELSLSLTVNGFIAANTALTKGGMREGDVLVLSKPLGTGTLFAARMHQQARGAWIEHALDIMQQSNGPAARRLRERGAHAATDVTGFGLLGHLLEMCAASDCGATLVLDQLPALPGALDCLAAGIESTLAPENRRFADRLINAADFSAHPKFALLFDPQTSGGLLAALPADSDTGELTVIGTVTASRTITLQ